MTLLPYPKAFIASLLIFATCTFIFSCKKDGNTPSNVSSQDPQTLSEAISVWHGKRMTGTMPSGNNSSSIVLEDPGFRRTGAIAGHIVFIPTMMQWGDIAGFYVQVKGANEYFKVDYAQPINISKNNGQPGNISVNSVRTQEKTTADVGLHVTGEGHFNDSGLVVKIPANIQTPDSIYLSYRAFDKNNNLSNTISLILYIYPLGGKENTKIFEGTWRESRVELSKDHQLTKSYDFVYNKWLSVLDPDLGNSGLKYYLRGDSIFLTWGTASQPYASYFLKGDTTEHFVNVFVPRPNEQAAGMDSVIYKSRDQSFKSDGTYTEAYALIHKMLYWDGKPMFMEYDQQGYSNGVWGYDAATNKLLIQLDSSAWGRIPMPSMEFPADITNNIWLKASESTDNYGVLWGRKTYFTKQ